MKKLKAVWNPRIEDDLHSFVVCGAITQKQAAKVLKELKKDGSEK